MHAYFRSVCADSSRPAQVPPSAWPGDFLVARRMNGGRVCDFLFGNLGPLTHDASRAHLPRSRLVMPSKFPRETIQSRAGNFSGLTHSGVKEEHPSAPSCQRRRVPAHALYRHAGHLAERPRQLDIQHHLCDIAHRRCISPVAEPRFREPWRRQSVLEPRIGWPGPSADV